MEIKYEFISLIYKKSRNIEIRKFKPKPKNARRKNRSNNNVSVIVKFLQRNIRLIWSTL